MKQVAEKTGELVDRYEQNMPTLQEILGTVNGYFKDAGIDLKDKNANSQSSSKAVSVMASQDSIDETNGRLTGIQMAGEEIKVQNVSQDVYKRQHLKSQAFLLNTTMKKARLARCV